MYLVVVVVLVKRQIRMVEDEDEEEGEYVTKEDVIVMTDKKGVTDAKTVDNMVMNTNEIFL